MKQEGHKIRYWIEDKQEKKVGDGMVDKVDNWEPSVNWADLVIGDEAHFGKDFDRLRARGVSVVGGTEYTDKLELDRGFGQEEMKRAGLTILPHYEFKSCSEAAEFVRKQPALYVLKPNGKVQNEKSLTYIGQKEDGSDLLQVLECYDRTWGSKINSLELQEKVRGVEVATAAFFNGKKFVEPVEVSFEHKHFMPGGNLLTGEMGTTMLWTNPTT